MAAKTKGKHGMGKRFAIVIGVVAVGVMALGAQTVIAQTAAQPPAVVKYDTKLTITHEGINKGVAPEGVALWHGGVVTPKVGDGFVCRADRSITIENGRLQDKKQGLR